MKVSKSASNVVIVVTVIASLVFANLIAVRHFVRIDLTKDGKYTLSAGSKQTVRSLKDAMVVTAYFTEGLPTPYASYARYVRDMLEEYRAASNGKLAFEFIDPAAEENADDKQKKKESTQDIFGRVVREATSVESELVNLGISPVEIRVIEDDQQQTKRAYMGLVIRYQGKKEVIPVVQDFGNFEKDLTVLMRRLVREKAPVVALINDLSGATVNKLKMLVAQNAELTELKLAELKSIPNNVDALVVVGTGRRLSDDAFKAIDAFVNSGKNAAFFVDQYEFDPETLVKRPAAEAKSGTKLKDLLSSYGVTLGDELIADQQCASLNLQEQRGGVVFGVPVKYPFMPQVMSLDQESPVTRGLSGVIFPFASPLTLSKTAKMKGVFLAKSSKKSWLEAEPFNTDPKREWQQKDVKESGQYGLVAELRKEGQKQSRILVAGTSAFLWDQFLSDENLALTVMSVDYLLADDVALSMRGRSFVDLPLNPEIGDDQRNALKLANILGVPLLLVLYGLYRWRRREHRRRSLSFDSIK